MRNIRNILLSVREEEQKIDLAPQKVIENSRFMVNYLIKKLETIKEYVVEKGFTDMQHEVEFFRKVKPEIQGKLIYYNKIYRIETTVPVGIWKVRKRFYSRELNEIEELYKEDQECPFCRYYYSGRTDKDHELFTRGNIDINCGLCSHIFDSDHRFSTYYDYKVARLIADELLYDYLALRISNNSNNNRNLQLDNIRLEWTDSKNALIELIYALHAKGCISDGNVSIRKIAQVMQAVFNIELVEVHHAFHRMKERINKRTGFLDELKTALEDYMDKDL